MCFESQPSSEMIPIFTKAKILLFRTTSSVMRRFESHYSTTFGTLFLSKISSFSECRVKVISRIKKRSANAKLTMTPTKQTSMSRSRLAGVKKSKKMSRIIAATKKIASTEQNTAFCKSFALLYKIYTKFEQKNQTKLLREHGIRRRAGNAKLAHLNLLAHPLLIFFISSMKLRQKGADPIYGASEAIADAEH